MVAFHRGYGSIEGMKETVAGGILLVVFVSVLWFLFGGSVKADLTGNDIDQGGSIGHPLWTD